MPGTLWKKAKETVETDQTIVKVVGREILDSRGNPTVEAEVHLADGTVGFGRAPSGASTGQFEALELRDGDAQRYGGKGVQRAVSHVNRQLHQLLCGENAVEIQKIDRCMQQADGTAAKTRLGANAILAVSWACAKAAAKSLGQPLYAFLGGAAGCTLPVPMMNILNGGLHADNGLDVQEFMILPVGAPSFREALRWCAQVYHTLAEQLRQKGFSTAVGDEGGFAPALSGTEAAIECILDAIQAAGFRAGEHFMLGIDAAASAWKGAAVGAYRLPKCGKRFSTEGLIDHWCRLVQRYPILSLEDPLDEEDWEGWQCLTRALGKQVQLVGDDLFVTHPLRVQQGIESGCGNGVLIKPNQIGSVSETLETVRLAQKAGYAAVISHRSGETGDTAIADLAVAVHAGQIKTGAPCRSERVEKYNRLLRIEEALGGQAVYPGRRAFPV